LAWLLFEHAEAADITMLEGIFHWGAALEAIEDY
jgi:hypothetical protein